MISQESHRGTSWYVLGSQILIMEVGPDTAYFKLPGFHRSIVWYTNILEIACLKMPLYLPQTWSYYGRFGLQGSFWNTLSGPSCVLGRNQSLFETASSEISYCHMLWPPGILRLGSSELEIHHAFQIARIPLKRHQVQSMLLQVNTISKVSYFCLRSQANRHAFQDPRIR